MKYFPSPMKLGKYQMTDFTGWLIDTGRATLRLLFEAVRFTKITLREFADDSLFLQSLALTFTTLLTLVPILAISLSLFKLFGGGEWFMETLRPVLARNLAPGNGPLVADKIESLIVQGSDTAWGGIGLIFLLLVVYGIFGLIEYTFNMIWGVSSNRGILHKLPQYWGLMTIIPLLILSSIALTTYLEAVPLIHDAFESVQYARSLFNRWFPTVLIMLGFFLLYRFLPNTRVRTYAALTGTLVAGFLYEMVKTGFIFYTGRIVHYDVIYGSLVIIPLLMVWVNLTWTVVLLGVEVSFVSQHYQLLKEKRKHMKYSRPQEDTLAYQMLIEVTQAFRGERSPVRLDEWSVNFGIPPAIVQSTFDLLNKGGVLELSGTKEQIVLLARDPDTITLEEIHNILTRENTFPWPLSSVNGWVRTRNWVEKQEKEKITAIKDQSLSDLVNLLLSNEETEVPSTEQVQPSVQE